MAAPGAMHVTFRGPSPLEHAGLWSPFGASEWTACRRRGGAATCWRRAGSETMRALLGPFEACCEGEGEIRMEMEPRHSCSADRANLSAQFVWSFFSHRLRPIQTGPLRIAFAQLNVCLRNHIPTGVVRSMKGVE
jgi:hypothetical protein